MYTTRQRSQSNIIGFFLGKTVAVHVEGKCVVHGKLVRYRLGYKRDHLPTVLILQNECGLVVLRAWSLISTR